MLKPNDWWIVSDDDEFHFYPKPIDELIDECEEYGYKFITGAFLDRIGEGGRFPKIDDDSDIWNEFPLAGTFRYPISNACPNKTVVMKGDIQVTNGQHYAMIDGKDTYGARWMNDLRYPVGDCFIQVNHFKWDVSVMSRLREVSRIKKSYTFHEEYKKMFDYIIDNLKIGGAGVISATTQFSGSLAKKVYDDFKKTGSSNDNEKLKAIRTAFDETGNLISALHTLKSLENKIYANLLPPLELLSQDKKDELIKKLKGLGVLNNKNMAALSLLQLHSS